MQFQYLTFQPGADVMRVCKIKCVASLLVFVIVLPRFIVLPAKNDSDDMFCLQSYQTLIESIDHLYINADRIDIQVIFRFKLAQAECTRMFYLTIVNKILHHCHSWLARQ